MSTLSVLADALINESCVAVAADTLEVLGNTATVFGRPRLSAALYVGARILRMIERLLS